MKTSKVAAKRFKLTGRGKLLRRQTGLNHLLTKKSERRKRGLRRAAAVFKGETRSVRAILPYGK